MDPKTPPFLELEEVQMKKQKRAISDDSSKTEVHQTQQKRKRRLQQYCSSSSEDEHEQKASLRATNKSSRRRAWINYQDSDSEHEASSHRVDDDELPLGVIQARAGAEGFQLIMTKYRGQGGRTPTLDSAPVFYPTEEEFQDTLKYIEKIRPLVEPYGICRVIPPSSWHPPCSLNDNAEEHMKFTTRVQKIHKLQVREPTTDYKTKGRQRISKVLTYSQSKRNNSNQPEFFGFEPGPMFSIKEFEGYANELKQQYFQYGEKCEDESKRFQAEPSLEEVEGEFWRIVERPTEQIEVLYGADIETNKFKSGLPKAIPGKESESGIYEKSGWNLNNIARLRNSILEFEEAEISGVVVPWLYVGMCFSSFCWHVEDHHLYSVNYMHWGSPKVWYGVPGYAATKLEGVMKKHLPELFNEQPDLLHKLVTQLSPSILKEEGVPVYKVIQNAGEFVITFPRAYHSGFNSGFNCAEAVNVAPVNWLPHGQSAVEIYKSQRRKTSISHDKLLLAAVKRAIKSKLAGETSGYASYMHTLADALKARMKLESARRETLGSLRIKQMDLSFDSTDERECCICAYDLHLSAVGCDCRPELYSCLEHARDLCRCTLSKKFVLYRHEISELDEFLRVLEDRQPKFKVYGTSIDLDLNRGLDLHPLELNSCSSASMEAANHGLTSRFVSTPPINQVLNPRFPVRNGPRVAKVVRTNRPSIDVQLLTAGRLVSKPGWHTKQVIIPAGFKSRVQFYNYLDLPQLCYYISEVLDCTDGKPLFKVSMESRPSEKFVCSSLDFCWQSVQERINTEIKKLRESGKPNLPPLRPPESLKGLDMFGFTAPFISQAVEALDPKHLCDEYWAEHSSSFEEDKYARALKGYAAHIQQHILSSNWYFPREEL